MVQTKKGILSVNPVDGAELIYVSAGEFIRGSEDYPHFRRRGNKHMEGRWFGYNFTEADCMSITIRARFDGKVIVPDEPLDYPVNEPLIVELMTLNEDSEKVDSLTIQERLARLKRATGRIHAPAIQSDMRRSDNFYEERE